MSEYKNSSDDSEMVAEILRKHERDRSEQQPVRDERIPDLAFARWSQNDDDMTQACTTEFLGEFNIVSRERKNIQAEFRQNEVEVKFRHKKEDDDELDKFVQGKYRTDRRLSKSRQCYNIAQDDVIDCGFGAWRLHTEDIDSEDALDTTLQIARSPIPEAIRTVFFDSSSKLADKSDAMWCSVITSYNEDSYKKFLDDNGIEASFNSFNAPYQSVYETLYPGQSMSYPLYSSGQREINLLEFYQVEPETVTYWQYLGVDAETGAEKINAIEEKEAKAAGLPKPFRKKKVKKDRCFKYVTNGCEILLRSQVPGGLIPIIPIYGERNFVNGIENFYGLVKAAKDPQKLINASYNYLASLMMFSPVPKPVYDPREIEGFESDYDDANSHLLAYQRKNKTFLSQDGKDIPFATEYTQPAQIPPAVTALISQLPGITDSILNPGVTEDSFSSDMSGVALQQVKEQVGVMRYIFLDNWNESMRRDGEVYAAMLAETVDTNTSVVITNSDGTTSNEMANDQYFDVKSMTVETKNPIKGAQFNVYSDVGPSYQSQRDAALGNLKELFASLPPGDPMQRIVMLSILSKQDGEGLEEVNKVARFEMLGMGLPGIEPQTSEEEEHVAMLQQQAAQQQEQPPLEAQILMMQEQTKQMQAQQSLMKEQNMTQANEIKAYQAQTGAQNDQANTMLKQVDSETKRMEAMIKAEQAGADIGNTQMDTVKKSVDAQLAQADLAEKEMNLQIKNMPTDELIRMMQL